MIPYGRHEITERDIQAVIDVLRSEFITQGQVIPRFEYAVANYCGADHGVAANSGTSALHLACRALGITQGDRVWTSPITFVASANCARYCGADVDLVDINPDTFNLSTEALAAKLEVAERQGSLPKAVIPVHLGGLPCDMAAIHELAWRYGFAVIEDASHAIGAHYRGEPVGSGRYSDITVFSFHPVKIITTAEGGMAVTNREDLAERMRLLRSHGITRDPEYMVRTPDGPWYYEQVDLGYNYRMTDLQAALGLSQMERLNAYIDRRHRIARKYNEDFASLPIRSQRQTTDSYSAYHLYVVRVAEAEHRGAFEALREHGIGVNLHYIPIHYHPDYRRLGFAIGDFPEAERYYNEAITLPLYPAMTNDDQASIVTALRRVLSP